MCRTALRSVVVAAAALVFACHGGREAKRRASADATATAEHIASTATLTSAAVEQESDAEAERARGEIIAALRLEQSDYRATLQRALDALDKDVGQVRRTGDRRDPGARKLRERRALLKGDLEAVDRSTEQDWAPLRTKIDRDVGRPQGP